MTSLICGSLAFDTIMSFDGRFSEALLADQLHKINVAFLVPGIRREFGGCAGDGGSHRCSMSSRACSICALHAMQSVPDSPSIHPRGRCRKPGRGDFQQYEHELHHFREGRGHGHGDAPGRAAPPGTDPEATRRDAAVAPDSASLRRRARSSPPARRCSPISPSARHWGTPNTRMMKSGAETWPKTGSITRLIL